MALLEMSLELPQKLLISYIPYIQPKGYIGSKISYISSNCSGMSKLKYFQNHFDYAMLGGKQLNISCVGIFVEHDKIDCVLLPYLKFRLK